MSVSLAKVYAPGTPVIILSPSGHHLDPLLPATIVESSDVPNGGAYIVSGTSVVGGMPIRQILFADQIAPTSTFL